MFTLAHQDGDIKYELETGGFSLAESKLYLSLETKAIEENGYPDCYKFAIDGYCVNANFSNLQIKIKTNPNDEPPNVYVYTTFHACEVEATVELVLVSENEIDVTLNVVSEDVNYYNEKARPNLFSGVVKLEKKALNELWIPS